MEPPKPQDLLAIFAKFAGREVPLVEDKAQNTLSLANDNDPVLQEMKKVAEDAGFCLRLWWPGHAGTMDYRLNRVNAAIVKTADGKWRVSNQFYIG